MPALTIRHLTPGDAADYRIIRLAALQQAPEAFGSLYESEAARPTSYFEERLITSTIVGAYRGSQIKGMASLTSEPGHKERHKGFLGGMYVDPDVRRQGVGAALIAAVFTHAPDTLEQIILSVVRDNNGAIALYRRFGFAIYGIEPRSLKSASVYFDEVLMIRFLAAPAAETPRLANDGPE